MKVTNKKIRVKISKRALYQRLKRVYWEKFKWEFHKNRQSQGDQWWRDFGDFYAIDVNTSSLAEAHIDPEAKARKLGVLKDYEVVSD